MRKFIKIFNTRCCRIHYWATHASTADIMFWTGIALLLSGMLYLMLVVVWMCFSWIE